MLNILLATSNPGKAVRYKRFFNSQDIKIYTCQELGIELPAVDEDADNEEVNSEEKAKKYFRALTNSEVDLPKGKWISMGVDTGLYFDSVGRREQPGPHVKGIAGAGVFRETQEETFQKMAVYYSALAKKYGGRLHGYFRDSYTLYDGQKTLQQDAKRPIELVDTMYLKDVNFPINSFLKVEGKYINEFSDEDYINYIAPGFKAVGKLITKIKLK
ncbi:MAG: non-canonical purine NTP pyrophosphatase [Patescibacteria group bacterium]